ncbi:hypothetical protein [Pelobacter propionicus]|nr:hypothetical protein [Pelobacter propionicus]
MVPKTSQYFKLAKSPMGRIHSPPEDAVMENGCAPLHDCDKQP